MTVIRRDLGSMVHLSLAMISPPYCITFTVSPLWGCCAQKTASSCLSMATTESDGGWDSASLSCARVQSQIERFAILEYSQLESDSGEAYNLRCYLWRDSKAAMRGDPRTLWGLSSFICPSLDQHMGGQRGVKTLWSFDHRLHAHTCTCNWQMLAATLLLWSSSQVLNNL